jgi:hypothetical protein
MSDELLLPIITGLILVGAILLLAFALYFAAAYQARQRGYRLWVWLFAMMLTNPLWGLIVLGILPHQKRKLLRREFEKELDDKLRNREIAMASGDVRPVSAISLGDQATYLWPDGSTADAPKRVVERSLGDLPTIDKDGA